MNFTAYCFGYEKTVFDYIEKLPIKFNAIFKRPLRFVKRSKRRFLMHKVKRYGYAKRELFLFGKVRGRVVYDTICAPNPKKKGYVMRWSEPSYCVDERGKRIAVF